MTLWILMSQRLSSRVQESGFSGHKNIIYISTQSCLLIACTVLVHCSSPKGKMSLIDLEDTRSKVKGQSTCTLNKKDKYLKTSLTKIKAGAL